MNKFFIGEVLYKLKVLINEAFRGGIDRVLNYNIQASGEIKGLFQDASQVYEFKITPDNKLSYIEFELKGKRSDSYLIGYFLDTGIKTDSNRNTKPKKCLVGKPCGQGCVTKGKECRYKLSLKQSVIINKLREATPAKLPSNAQELDQNARDISKKFNVSPVVAIGAASGAALLSVPMLGAAGYMAFRNNYHEGFKKSAAEIKRDVDEGSRGYSESGVEYIQIFKEAPDSLKSGVHKDLIHGNNQQKPQPTQPDIDDIFSAQFENGKWSARPKQPEATTPKQDADQITFVVGGFAGQGGQNSQHYADQFYPPEGSQLRQDLEARMSQYGIGADLFENHHVVPVDNRDFELRPASERGEGFQIDLPGLTVTDETAEQFKVMLGASVVKGYNPTAYNLAFQAYTYHKKHPDKPINLLGYSAGGMAVHEAAHILKELGIKNVRTAAFGSPYFGLTDKVYPGITFASKFDPVVNAGKIPIRNPVMANTANHFTYLQEPSVRRHLKNLFDGKEPQSEDIWFPGFQSAPQTQSPFNPEEFKNNQNPDTVSQGRKEQRNSDPERMKRVTEYMQNRRRRK